LSRRTIVEFSSAPVRQALSLAMISEEMARLEHALESLPDAQREIILLRKLEELTFPDSVLIGLGQRAILVKVALESTGR